MSVLPKKNEESDDLKQSVKISLFLKVLTRVLFKINKKIRTEYLHMKRRIDKVSQ